MKELISWIKWGALIGIVISLMFLLAFDNSLFDLRVWMHFVLFGLIAGVMITAGNNITCRSFPSDSKWFLLVQLLLNYLISALVFYITAVVYRTYIYSFFPNQRAIIGTSLGVGIASMVISLFWSYSVEKDERLKLEIQNRKLAVVEERNRIARELHDAVSQNLFGIALNLDTLKFQIEQNPKEANGVVDQIKEMVIEIQTEMRLMIYELQPATLGDKGLFEAVQNLAGLFRRRYSLNIGCNFSGDDGDLEERKQLALYRVIQESLNNVARHAKAGKVRVVMEVKEGLGSLEVRDDGQGFELTELKNKGHLGVRGMRERVSEVGGEFKIESTLNKGTTVMVKV